MSDAWHKNRCSAVKVTAEKHHSHGKQVWSPFPCAAFWSAANLIYRILGHWTIYLIFFEPEPSTSPIFRQLCYDTKTDYFYLTDFMME